MDESSVESLVVDDLGDVDAWMEGRLAVEPFAIEVDGQRLVRESVSVSQDRLFVMFTVHGPRASPAFPKEHVVVVRDGDDEKLTSLGGSGGDNSDQSAFYLWRLQWPGGRSVRVIYLSSANEVLAEENLLIGA